MCFNHSPSWTRPTTPIYLASTSSGISCLSTRHAVRNTSNLRPRKFWRTRWIPMPPVWCEEMVRRPVKVARLSARHRPRRRALALITNSIPLDISRRHPVWRSQAGDPCTPLRAPTTKVTSETGQCGRSPCIPLRLYPHLWSHRVVNGHR